MTGAFYFTTTPRPPINRILFAVGSETVPGHDGVYRFSVLLFYRKPIWREPGEDNFQRTLVMPVMLCFAETKIDETRS